MGSTVFDLPSAEVQSRGLIVPTALVAQRHGSTVSETVQRLRWIDGAWSRETLNIFEIENAIVTSVFTVIDQSTNSYMVDQSYSNLQAYFGIQPVLNGKSYAFHGAAKVWEEPHIIIGGPVDGVWHHWLMQWSARLSVVKRLRPDLLSNPKVKFLIDSGASEQPFLAIIEAFGISKDRVTFVTSHENHLVKRAYVVSFLDQNYYYPTILEEFINQMREGLDVRATENPTTRLFCSRQGFDTPKRRVANFGDIRPIIERRGFQIVELGTLTAREQFQLFTSAQCVMSVHGADLAGLLFCQPETSLILMETPANLESGLTGTYRTLANLRGMAHATVLVDPISEAGVDYTHFGPRHNRDYVIDPSELDRTLAALGID